MYINEHTSPPLRRINYVCIFSKLFSENWILIDVHLHVYVNKTDFYTLLNMYINPPVLWVRKPSRIMYMSLLMYDHLKVLDDLHV